MKITSVISFSQSSSSGRPFALVQKDWPEKTAANFGDWLEANGYNPTIGQSLWLYEQYKSACTGDGELVATLRVRLLDLATPYVLRSSYGTVGDPVFVSEGRTEYLAFELSSTQSVDFGVIQSASWNGDVYNAEGNIIDAPIVTCSAQTVTVTEPVYGVLEVQIIEEMHEHSLTITARTPTAEQAQRLEDGDNIYAELYAATAMLFCNQQIDLLDINMPENFGNCSGTPGKHGSTDNNNDDDQDAEQWYSVLFHAFDYCQGKAIEGAEYWVDGIKVAGTQALLQGGTHTIVVRASGYMPSDEDDLEDNDTFTLPAS